MIHDDAPPPDPGAADPRNRLNDLSGREWTYALRSVIATRYPTSGAESYAHALRRAHPSPKPPQLMAELIRFFTERGAGTGPVRRRRRDAAGLRAGGAARHRR
jgi:hypothetical protein